MSITRRTATEPVTLTLPLPSLGFKDFFTLAPTSSLHTHSSWIDSSSKATVLEPE